MRRRPPSRRVARPPVIDRFISEEDLRWGAPEPPKTITRNFGSAAADVADAAGSRLRALVNEALKCCVTASAAEDQELRRLTAALNSLQGVLTSARADLDTLTLE